MRILVIGPFPLPIHGCSLANEVLFKQFSMLDFIKIRVINTNTANISSDTVGVFTFKKVFSFLKSYRNIWLVSNSQVVYTTPGQTFFGIVKYVPFYLLCILTNVPYVIHVHGNYLGKEYSSLSGIKKIVFRYFVSKAAAGIVLSESLKNNFHGLLPNSMVYIVENFAVDELTSIKDISKPRDMLRITYLSNLMKEKGILDLLDSLLLLKKTGVPFKVDIAGKMDDDNQDEVILKLADLGHHVTYHNVINGQSKNDFLFNSNVFVLPTYYKMEGQPISLIEAMASGNIIITTKFSGIPDIVSSDNGFFVESNNPEDLCARLLDIHQNLSYYMDLISDFNINYVLNNFTERRFSDKVLSILKVVCK